MNICEYFDNGQCRDDGCACMFEPDIRNNFGKVPEYLAWDCCTWYRVVEEAPAVGEADDTPAHSPEEPVVEKKCLRCGAGNVCLDDGQQCVSLESQRDCPDYVPEGGTACGRCGTDGVCSHDGTFCHMRDYPEECNLYVEPDEEAETADESGVETEAAPSVSEADSSPIPAGQGSLAVEPFEEPEEDEMNEMCEFYRNGQCNDAEGPEPCAFVDMWEQCPWYMVRDPYEEDLEERTADEAEAELPGEEDSSPASAPEEDGRLRIVYIDVGLIDPAPWNRNIGDVSELAASIKAEGVHTPLTVCPHVQGLEGRYTAVAGNRRRAAAQKAGLEQVPCIVRPLSEVQSLTMMLSENVNRKAMTPVEEANAMQQLMLQLPENTAAAVSRATGISKTTVGRRLKLAKLPGEALAQAEERGGTLADYEKIVSLTDPAEQEKVLQAVGTKDFDREYQKARSRQEDRAAFRRRVDTLEKKGAKRLTERERAARNAELSNEKTIYSWQLTSQNVGKLDRGEEWFYTASELKMEIRIYKLIRKRPEETPSVSEADSSPIPAGQGSHKSDVDKAKEELEEAKREAREELDGIKAEANQMDQEFLELREGFVEKVMLNAYQEEIMETAVMAMLYVPYWAGDRQKEVGRWLGLEDITDQEAVRRAVRGNPVKALLSVAYCLLEKEARSWTKWGLYDTDIRAYQMEHRKEKNLELLYRCLETMGYQMSGDELAAQAGSWDGYDRADRAMKGFKERKKELDKRIYK